MTLKIVEIGGGFPLLNASYKVFATIINSGLAPIKNSRKEETVSAFTKAQYNNLTVKEIAISIISVLFSILGSIRYNQKKCNMGRVETKGCAEKNNKHNKINVTHSQPTLK